MENPKCDDVQKLALIGSFLRILLPCKVKYELHNPKILVLIGLIYTSPEGPLLSLLMNIFISRRQLTATLLIIRLNFLWFF